VSNSKEADCFINLTPLDPLSFEVQGEGEMFFQEGLAPPFTPQSLRVVRKRGFNILLNYFAVLFALSVKV
jgi:hypothetical protein